MSIGIRAALTAAAALLALLLLLAAALAATLNALTGGGLGTSAPSAAARADIPPALLTLYQRAAPTCPGLDWTVLAAIGKVETDHGRDPVMVSSAGAVGPMQFEPSTFAAYANPVPPGGKNPPTPWDPTDAVYAAARLLCASGARGGKDLYHALYTYNHDPTYVTTVLKQANAYSQPTPATSIPCTAFQSTPQPHSGQVSSAALTAVRFACTQLGKPYVWGGNGDPGFDCSGLTQAAYAAAGIALPRTAQSQYDAGPRLPAGTPLQPGDLVFFGTPRHIHHVGISLGGTSMVNAPELQHPVQVQDFRDFPDYAGASRPAK
jgi:cell wall-associated NlpC family hydrolase